MVEDLADGRAGEPRQTAFLLPPGECTLDCGLLRDNVAHRLGDSLRIARVDGYGEGQAVEISVDACPLEVDDRQS